VFKFYSFLFGVRRQHALRDIVLAFPFARHTVVLYLNERT